MKKKLSILVVVIIFLLIFCGCFLWFKYATQGNKQEDLNLANINNTANISNSSTNSTINNQISTTNNQQPTTISNEPIFTVENYPRVDASLAIHPLVDSIASNFLGIPEEELNYEYTKTRTSDVYKNLVDGKVDVIFVAEPSQDDYDYAASKGVELNVLPVTSSAFVFIVNTQNKVDNLTLDQIIKIYKGDILNWKEVGGEDGEIIPYQRPNGSGSQTAMISLVMKDANLMTAPKMQIEGEMGGLVDAIGEYDNSKNAIGYSYFYYVNTMYKRDSIKMLGINGVKPTIETIKNGTYPVYTNGYVVTLKGISKDSSAQKWVDALTSPRGSKIIEDAGYVPVN